MKKDLICPVCNKPILPSQTKVDHIFYIHARCILKLEKPELDRMLERKAGDLEKRIKPR